MDFLLYLTPVGAEIINTIEKLKITIQENPPICKKYKDLFGYTDINKFILCTNNIKNTISPVKFYVNETVYHEAVHVAQNCKKGTLDIENPILEDRKKIDVQNSLQHNKDGYHYEVEAYYLEDNPEIVLSYLKKYCL